MDAGLALMYSLISTVGCGLSYYILNKSGRKISSEIVNSESNQWLMDTILSAAVLVGFLIVAIISKTQYIFLTKYIDSIMVIASSLFFIEFSRVDQLLLLRPASMLLDNCCNS